MKRFIFAGACAVTLGLWAWPTFRCWARGRGHVPKRHPMGAYRCEICGKAGGTLGEMGFDGSSQVDPYQRAYSRKNGGEFTREWWS